MSDDLDFDTLSALWQRTEINVPKLRRKANRGSFWLYIVASLDWVFVTAITMVAIAWVMSEPKPESFLLSAIALPVIWGTMAYAIWLRRGLFRAANDSTLAMIELMIRRYEAFLRFLRNFPIYFAVCFIPGFFAGFFSSRIAEEGDSLGDRIGLENMLIFIAVWAIWMIAFLIYLYAYAGPKKRRELAELKKMRRQLLDEGAE